VAADLDALHRAFQLCVRKARRNIRDLADEPKSWAWAVDGDYSSWPERFFEIGNWTSSFFTGMALLAWRETEDECFLREVLRLAPAYREKACVRHLDMHHDTGFLYTLYSVALHQLTGDPAHREVGLAAAGALARRFNPRGNFIRAWGRLDSAEHENVTIIDCLMNLPLLYWASKQSGNRRYRDIALRQADTSLKCFVRPDDSVFHAWRFDLSSGESLGPDNHCGHRVDSYWARGAAWAIYGFALTYRHTGEPRFLAASLRLARRFILELDEESVPVWDFRLPADAPRVRDASAAAVAVCGFQELETLGAAEAGITNAKGALLRRITSDDYLEDSDQDCRGVLRSAYGDKVAYSSWGDYFLMEALDRELHGHETFW